ncbi:MAG TPA: L,D-transpeptidase, partial [Acidimicrobiia bacterium]|nr:L,D-transpeptidase [Acidimicrobiia bacterium]
AFTPFVTATTNGADLVAYTEPVEGAAPVETFSALTEYGFPRTLLVTAQQEGWVQALLPMRPTGSLGWVRAADVTLGSTTMEIKVSLSAHQLVLLDAGVPVLETRVAIGKETTPTTVGQFYVTDPLDLSSDPNSDYGVFAIGISGYSDVLTSFRGGDGQLAIHGGAWESQLGTGVSAGCVRVLNDTILQIAGLVPLGAPVTITA